MTYPQLERIEEPRTDEERQIYELLDIIRRDYEKQCKPYIDRLVLLQSIKTPIFYAAMRK